MRLHATRRLILVLVLVASAALTGCGGASVVDDIGRGAARTGDEAPIPGAERPRVSGIGDDASSLGGAFVELSRAEAESTEARTVLERMAQGDEREWVCLGLDVVEASDGGLTIEDYARHLTERGFGYVPYYRVQQAFGASVQLLEGDVSQLQEIACL